MVEDDIQRRASMCNSYTPQYFGLILLREPHVKMSGFVTFYTFGGFGSTHSDGSGYHFHEKQVQQYDCLEFPALFETIARLDR